MSKLKYNVKPFLFLLPSIILMLLFVFYPLINTIMISFISPNGSLSLGNYKYTYGLEGFNTAIYNTGLYTFFVTIIELLLSLVIAYALSQKIKLKNTFQTIFFLPYVTSVVAIGTVFQIMYNADYGIINQILVAIGLNPVTWLDADHALISIIVFGIWKGLAFNILIIFTAFSTINPNLEKAAIVDGFSNIGTFIKIKLPQIKGVLIYLFTMDIIFNIKVYEEVVALFGTINPGPGGSANTIVYMIYQMTINDPAVSAVLAVTLLVIVIVIRQTMVVAPKVYKKLTTKA